MFPIGEFLENNRRFAERSFFGMLPLKPSSQLAIVACMDSRMPVFSILGLRPGQAHIMRNAGGVVTDDVIRSLTLSQRLMNTNSIILIHHTDCGLTKISEDKMRADLEHETGMRPWFALESFQDPATDVRQSIRRLKRSPFLLHTDQIYGFVYEVETGLLKTVEG